MPTVYKISRAHQKNRGEYLSFTRANEYGDGKFGITTATTKTPISVSLSYSLTIMGKCISLAKCTRLYYRLSALYDVVEFFKIEYTTFYKFLHSNNIHTG